MVAELAFSDGPNEKVDLTVSVEAVVDGAEDSEPGRGPKVKGRGDGVDCGGGKPVKGVAAFGGSPNNEDVLCGAVVDVAVVGSNNGFGSIGAASGIFSVPSPATSENGRFVVTF